MAQQPLTPIPPAILAQLRVDFPLLIRMILRAHDARNSALRNQQAAARQQAR